MGHKYYNITSVTTLRRRGATARFLVTVVSPKMKRMSIIANAVTESAGVLPVRLRISEQSNKPIATTIRLRAHKGDVASA